MKFYHCTKYKNNGEEENYKWCKCSDDSCSSYWNYCSDNCKDKIRGEKLEDERERKKIKESKLEGVGKKARDAFLKPVKAIGNKAKGIFDTLKNVLGLLFVGWLGNKGFDAIELSAEGNIKALEDLRNEVVTTINEIAILLFCTITAIWNIGHSTAFEISLLNILR